MDLTIEHPRQIELLEQAQRAIVRARVVGDEERHFARRVGKDAAHALDEPIVSPHQRDAHDYFAAFGGEVVVRLEDLQRHDDGPERAPTRML
jgi:hypothetical protein